MHFILFDLARFVRSMVDLLMLGSLRFFYSNFKLVSHIVQQGCVLDASGRDAKHLHIVTLESNVFRNASSSTKFLRSVERLISIVRAFSTIDCTNISFEILFISCCIVLSNWHTP